MPTESDVLRARAMTTGIIIVPFMVIENVLNKYYQTMYYVIIMQLSLFQYKIQVTSFATKYSCTVIVLYYLDIQGVH